MSHPNPRTQEKYIASHQRVNHAELLYRLSPYDDWRRLEEAYELSEDDKLGKTVVGNVCDVFINHQAISVCQQARLYKPHVQSHGKKDSDRIRCRVSFSGNEDFMIDEVTQENRQVISISFSTRQVPQVQNDSHVPDSTPSEAKGEALAVLGETALGLPLAKSAQALASTGWVEVKLVFVRAEGKERKWNWPAVLHFLSGWQEMRTSLTLASYKNLSSLPLLELAKDPWIKDQLQRMANGFLLIPFPKPKQLTVSLKRPRPDDEQQMGRPSPYHPEALEPKRGTPPPTITSRAEKERKIMELKAKCELAAEMEEEIRARRLRYEEQIADLEKTLGE
ncbi:MAG: hypothetical protein Q9219_001776 [cf. Caloplaca sp. 3 TL-2023]